MGEIARKQCAERWAVYDPGNVLRVETIKREIPNALFVHIIRDGRDVALSLRKLGDFNPLPWNRKPRSLEETALYWEWMVQKGRSFGQKIPRDYMEIRFEGLLGDPPRTLKELGNFLNHDLDYRRIQTAALGTVSKSNSSFREEARDGGINPVKRWKQRLSQDQVASLEWHIGKTLESAGYSLTGPPINWKPGVKDRFLRAIYPSFLDSKLWLKTGTGLGRFSKSDRLELAPEADSSLGVSP
jgi:hypothetical protein